MIREKNYSLIKAIRESGCGSKSEGGGGEPTFDDVVKYYTGFSPDEIEDWKILQNADEHTTWPSAPYVKVSDSETDAFNDFTDSEDNYWYQDPVSGEAFPSFGKTTGYFVCGVKYNKPSPI